MTERIGHWWAVELYEQDRSFHLHTLQEMVARNCLAAMDGRQTGRVVLAVMPTLETAMEEKRRLARMVFSKADVA